VVDSALLRKNPYALAALANNARARRSNWRMFIQFCTERHYTPLPAAPVLVREFLEASFGGAEPKSAATVERYLSTIAHAHTLADLPDPTKTAQVKGAYRRLARNRPGSQPKAALRYSHITYALENLKTSNAAWDLRAKALLAVAHCTMARRAELVALRVEDVTFNADTGDGVALIRNTKAGREESRYLSRESVAQLRAWMAHAEIAGGAVLRRLTNTGLVGQTAIAPTSKQPMGASVTYVVCSSMRKRGPFDTLLWTQATGGSVIKCSSHHNGSGTCAGRILRYPSI
jgi:integrase